MSVVKVPDAGGDTLRLLELEEFLFPPYHADIIRDLPQLPLGEDDVIVCGYPQSGVHWVWSLTRMLAAGGTDVGEANEDDVRLELMSRTELERVPSPRLLTSHVPFRYLPQSVLEKHCRLIYVTRNVKDAAVASYNHHRTQTGLFNYRGIWSNFLPAFIEGKVAYGSWFDHVLEWEAIMESYRNLPILLLNYEDMKEDILRETRKLSMFLGQNHDDELIRAVCKASTRREDPDIDIKADRQPIIYRKGDVGDWKNWFTVAQSEWMDRMIRQKMKNSELLFRYSLIQDDYPPVDAGKRVRKVSQV